jgi:peroxiredoxin
MRKRRSIARSFVFFIAVFSFFAAPLFFHAAAGPEEAATLTKAGQVVPDFKVTSLDGREYSREALRGKVVLLNFFATWCGPCLAELPRVEKEIWQKYKDRGLVVLVVGREHENAEVAQFQKKQKYTFAMAADPKREVYGKFATHYIPRTYLIDRDGKIAHQAVGYTEPEFKTLVEAIEKQLAK